MDNVSEGAVALAEAKLQQGQPPKDRVFYARHHTAIKWTPYRPNSQEVKRGKMGRWQELRPFGIGWQNTEVVPEAGAWVEDIINRPELSTRAAPPAMDREAVVEAAAISLIVDLCGPGASQSATNVRVVEDHLRQFASTLSADAIRQGEGEDAGKKLMSLSRFMGEQTERENVVAWLRARGDSKPHGTDWRAYYEAADAIELGSHEPATPASHASDGGKA